MKDICHALILPIFKLVQIFLESVGVCLCFDLPIKDGKQSHCGPYIVAGVIGVDKEQGRANDRSLRNPGGHLANVGSLSFDDNLLGPVREEFFDPAKNLFMDTVVTKLEKASLTTLEKSSKTLFICPPSSSVVSRGVQVVDCDSCDSLDLFLRNPCLISITLVCRNLDLLRQYK